MNAKIADVGIVVIGRNEGKFLRASLASALSATAAVVYVDSGSTDDSLEIAADLGVVVLELDTSIPFTAARAYNAGVNHLLARYSSVQFIQFLDGDAQLVAGWVHTAYSVLVNNPEVAVVCGRRREKFVERSIFNLLADMEWNTAIGEVTACGPEAMMRLSLFQTIRGFDETLIAGEEPEICFRFRQAGGEIWRIDAETSRHDMNMMTVGQWWQRSRRGGYAFAESAWIHRNKTGHYRGKHCLRIWFWTLGLPALAIVLSLITAKASLLLLPIGYGITLYKTYRGAIQHRQYSTSHAWIYSLSCLLIKFPELQGQLEFIFFKLLRRQRQIIEYKGPALKKVP